MAGPRWHHTATHMKFQDLKQQSKQKILLRGESGSGKTYTAAKIALEVATNGGRTLYADTESEGSTTLVHLIESGEYNKSDVDNIDYQQVESYEDLVDVVSHETQKDYDLLVLDTIDHKHSYVLKEVTGAKRESDAEWNEFMTIYSEEKEIMEKIGKPQTNIVATLDPESGKNDKPKGAQTNIHGYFGIVVDTVRRGDGEWGTIIDNYVGRPDAINTNPPNFVEKMSEEILERVK